MFFVRIIWLLGFMVFSTAKVTPKVKCTPETMRIEIPTSSTTKEVYLEGLRDYPDPACRSRRDPTGSLTILELSLKDVYRCAVMRITNNFTGKQMYYQTVVIENNISLNGSTQPSKEILHVKCSVSGYEHAIEKRNVLPAGFQEEEELEITTTLTKIAPEPILGVGVRHEGNLITGDLNVSPKTPLQMEIFLDKVSAPVYGLLVTHMQVTDTKSQEETIIYNGCSIDTYLFENFNTVDGDFLTAKFRAFKFPDSSYVQFKGTVNVCLDRCKGVECSAGQIGYGRRKREIPPLPADPNKVFEITITSFIKINNNDDEFGDIETRNRTKYFKPKELAVANQLSDKMAYALVNQPSNLKLKELTEEESYTSIFAENVSTSHRLETVVLILAISRLFL